MVQPNEHCSLDIICNFSSDSSVVSSVGRHGSTMDKHRGERPAEPRRRERRQLRVHRGVHVGGAWGRRQDPRRDAGVREAFGDRAAAVERHTDSALLEWETGTRADGQGDTNRELLDI